MKPYVAFTSLVLTHLVCFCFGLYFLCVGIDYLAFVFCGLSLAMLVFLSVFFVKDGISERMAYTLVPVVIQITLYLLNGLTTH